MTLMMKMLHCDLDNWPFGPERS